MSVLFIVRTPLQAWLASSIRACEQITQFDCIYLTLEDSEEDQSAFEAIQAGARKCWYLALKPRRFDILLQFDISARLLALTTGSKADWQRIYLASYDCHGINALAIRSFLPITTFDDGTANFSAASSYGFQPVSKRERVYRRLLGGTSNRDFVSRIDRHYTIFDSKDHLVDQSRRVPIKGPSRVGARSSTSVARYFIGAPFSQALHAEHVERLRTAAASVEIDRYVPHPRETRYLDLGPDVKVLDKRGEIAELAIERDAGDREIWLYGWYSTVMFTMRPVAARRVIFLIKEGANTTEHSRLAFDAGCEVVII